MSDSADSPTSPADGESERAMDSGGQGDVIPGRAAGMLPLVGLGGSAGSIPALQTFFSHADADAGLVYVVVLHLSPEHESTLAAVLQHSTGMPVTQVKGKTKVEPNHVYVIPPGKQLEMTNGHLILSDLGRTPGKRVAVDLFFRTLADTHGPKSCAIVLSGSDSDGAIGVKRIKEMGGLTVAEDPNEAQFDSMPRAAIATGMVDWVLPVSEMPGRLVTYFRNEARVRLPGETEPLPTGREEEKTEADDEMALREVLGFLRATTGRDFSYYKRATVLRRIARRMQVNSVLDLHDYLSFLGTHPEECGALLQDLLISVTNFFRDRAPFQELENNLSRLFEGKKSSDQIRVWVPGCATGEEAYSIAMLLTEKASRMESPPRLQVFATDIDEGALNAARDGAYPETIAADVSEERLRRFFVKEHQVYRIKRSLRETLLFALHDLLRDFPFSRIDLISCRNLLIYLNRSAQNRAFEVFHFALRPDGQLFLGSSESAEEAGSLFYPLDKKARLYARATVPRPNLPSFSGQTTTARILRLQSAEPSVVSSTIPPPTEAGSSSLPPVAARTGISWAELHLKMIEQLAPPSVLVDQNDEIVHLSKNAGRFFQFSGGEPSTNVLRVVNPMLRVDLRSALYRAAQTRSTVELQGIPIELEGVASAVDISVRPIADVSPGYFLILFKDGGERPAEEPAAAGAPTLPSAAVTHLEEELELVKGELRDTIEQFEIGSEELKSSNEELQAMNEELRSATEELETSREELQSINEELTTVNQELKSKVEEVSRSNSDLQNLMSSTNIATIFLDRELQIKGYTPAAVPLFNLIHSDIGRPLSDLKPRFEYPTLSADAERVLRDLSLVELEIHSSEGRWFLARLLPYRTTEDQIGGVVLTFIDITQRKQVEQALSRSEQNLTEELRSMSDLHEMTMRVLNTSDLSSTLHEVLAAATRLNDTDLGSVHLFDPAENRLHLAGTSGFGPEFAGEYGTIDPDRGGAFARAVKDNRRVVIEDYQSESGLEQEARRAETLGYRAVLITPLKTRTGELLGIMSIHFRQPCLLEGKDLQRTDLYARQAADLIERKRAEEALRNSEERIRAIVNQATVGIGQLDLHGRILFVNPTLCDLLGQPESELLGKDVRELIPTDDWNDARTAVQPLLEQGKSLEIERRYRRRDGSTIWASVSVAPARDAQGRLHSILVCAADITHRLEDQKALKQALEENKKARAEVEAAVVAKDRFLAILSHELRTPLTPVLVTLGSLSRRTDLSERVREGLDMIKRNVEIEAHFIDDLLDVTRISRDKFEIVRRPMDVHESIRHAIEISEPDLQAKQQRLTVSLDAREHSINGDSARIGQIVWNVLKNASKFSPEGSEIRLSSRNEADRILITISDPGIGIDPAALPHIFDPFVQGGDSVSREFSGLGLGLAISKATVDAHGGTFRALSAGPGSGATFTFSLPLLKPSID